MIFGLHAFIRPLQTTPVWALDKTGPAAKPEKPAAKRPKKKK